MKKFFSGTEFKVFIMILLVISVGLIAFYGYNEYTYRKIGVCISEGNYGLADNYIDGVSPSYKDMRKIKSLLDIIENIDYDNPNDINRAYSKLETLKGFTNENINYVYNSLVLSLYQKIYVAEAYASAMTVPLPETPTEPLIVTTSERTTSTSEMSEIPTEASTVTEFYSAVTTTLPETTETEYFTAEPTSTTYNNTTFSTVITTTQPTTVYTTAQRTTIRETTANQTQSTGTVYYVESGEVYHISADCRTHSRSSNILGGPIPEGRRVCKVCG